MESLRACGVVSTSNYPCSLSPWQVSTAVLSITAKAKKKEKEKKEKEEEKMEVVSAQFFISCPEMIYIISSSDSTNLLLDTFGPQKHE